VDKLDAFVGMMSERHVRGTEFGELQLAIWTRQFQALRDGDRFFYQNDPALSVINQSLGIDYRRTLAQIIALNTDIPLSALNENVFLLADEADPDSRDHRLRRNHTHQSDGGYRTTGDRPFGRRDGREN
jgi:peroxidase